MPIHRSTYERRFRSNYDIQPNGCWIWNKSMRHDGYPNAIFRGITGAHRVSYYLHHGINPGGSLVCHRCDTPMCVNPDHLFLSDAAGNNHDMISKGRHKSSKGVSNGSAKLTDDDVRAIRAAYIPYVVTLSDLADVYGVSFQLISQIINNKNWTHVT